ncbi:hypothetical protein ACLKA7_003720 [Drosophila subpalustris]
MLGRYEDVAGQNKNKNKISPSPSSSSSRMRVFAFCAPEIVLMFLAIYCCDYVASHRESQSGGKGAIIEKHLMFLLLILR